ncbi:MAG TPA: S24/S26 family peptidase [Ktedonobacteraceae bacterium]|nr:S24/S26 family peptidase [Ktedonobacteraceae bacterium]
MTSMTPSTTPPSDIIASLFIQAVRQGQSLWFRVASDSMLPLIRRGDSVFIQPATAQEIRIGDIAAFESSDNLVIHRIVSTQQVTGSIRLLQLSDVELLPSWVKEQAVVGKVVLLRRQQRQIDLRHPIAQWWGKVTAGIRYQLYLHSTKNGPGRLLLRVCSRLTLNLGNWCLRRLCASPAPHD